MSRSFPLYWIAFLPLLSGFILLLSGPRMRRATAHLLALGALAASAALAAWALIDGLLPLVQKWNGLPEFLKSAARNHPRLVDDLGAWIQTGSFAVRVRFVADSLALCTTLLTLTIGLAIQTFARVLLHQKELWWKNLGAVNLTTGAVLTFVLADNMILGLAGWVLAGVCGSLAVGLDGPSAEASRAARTAWLVARLSDMMLLLALLVVLSYCRTLTYDELTRSVHLLSSPKNRWILGLKPVYIATALLGGAALCRAGQFPLHLWLAESSAGSGLSSVLASSIVAPTGVYLLLKHSVVIQRSPAALLAVASVAAVSALLLALAACAQNHLRRAITYLAACQLGIALVAAGTGNFTGSFFHMAVIVLSSTALIMTATAVERSLKGQQDLREMGSMLRTMPVTGGTFLLSALTLAGFIPLSGWRSTGDVLQRALTHIFPQSLARMHTLMRPTPAVTAAFSWALFFVCGFAAAVCAFGLLRLFFRVFTASPDQPSELKGKRLPAVLAATMVVVSVTAAACGILWEGTLTRWFDLDAFLTSSFKGQIHWIVRDGWRALGTGDLVHLKSTARLMVTLLHQAGLLLAAFLAAFFFFGRVRRVTAGRIISFRPYRWFYRLLYRELGAGVTLRFFSERILTGLSWIERSVTERLMADGLMTRLPVRIVQAAGWISARAQMWNRKAFIAAAVTTLALLAAMAGRPIQAVSVHTEGLAAVLHVGTGPAGRSAGPIQVRWDLDGDGRWDRSGATVFHEFPKAGPYEITVEVYDPRFKTRTRLTRRIRAESRRPGRDPARLRRPRPLDPSVRPPDESTPPGVVR